MTPTFTTTLNGATIVGTINGPTRIVTLAGSVYGTPNHGPIMKAS